MIPLIKILVLLLVAFLTYDTIYFFVNTNATERLKLQQLELRKEYEAIEVPEDPLLSTNDAGRDDFADDIIVFGLGLFVVITGVCALIAFVAKLDRRRTGKTSSDTFLECENCPQEKKSNVQPIMSYYMENYEEDYSEYGADHPRLMRTYSDAQLATSPYIDLIQNFVHEGNLPAREFANEKTIEETSRWLPTSEDNESEPDVKTQVDQETSAHEEFERADFSEKNLNDNSVSMIDFNLLSINTSLSVQNTLTKQDAALTQTETTFICECPLDKFEERLGAVEHGLKTSGDAQILWSKRIEQAETDIVNLHRQMYTILSKAEFVAPSSEVFSKKAGDSSLNDIYDGNLYEIPDVLLETKSQLEEGDLFKSSLRKVKKIESDEDLVDGEKWKIRMERDLTNKINEIAMEADRPKTRQIDDIYDQTKLKEELLRKNEEVKEKTKHLFKSMEEVLRGGVSGGGSTLKKSKLSVHSHYVAPYRRIQNADPDHVTSLYSNNQVSNKLMSKIKIK